MNLILSTTKKKREYEEKGHLDYDTIKNNYMAVEIYIHNTRHFEFSPNINKIWTLPRTVCNECMIAVHEVCLTKVS